jgi:hypothetical protein
MKPMLARAASSSPADPLGAGAANAEATPAAHAAGASHDVAPGDVAINLLPVDAEAEPDPRAIQRADGMLQDMLQKLGLQIAEPERKALAKHLARTGFGTDESFGRLEQALATMRAVDTQLTPRDIVAIGQVLAQEGILSSGDLQSLQTSASVRDAARAFFSGALVTTASFGAARAGMTATTLGMAAAGAPAAAAAVVPPLVLCTLAATLNAAAAEHSRRAQLGPAFAPDPPQAPVTQQPLAQQLAVTNRNQVPFDAFSHSFLLADTALTLAGVSDPLTQQGAMCVASSCAGGATGLGLWGCGPRHAAQEAGRAPPYLVPRKADGSLDQDKLRSNVRALQQGYGRSAADYLAQAFCCTPQARTAAADQFREGRPTFVRNSLGNAIALLPATGLGMAAGFAKGAGNLAGAALLRAMSYLCLINPGWRNRQAAANVVNDVGQRLGAFQA